MQTNYKMRVEGSQAQSKAMDLGLHFRRGSAGSNPAPRIFLINIFTSIANSTKPKFLS